MLDLRGREVRYTETENGEPIQLEAGSTVTIDCAWASYKSKRKMLFTAFNDLPRLVKPRETLFIEDGKAILQVTEVLVDQV